jgi:drug/metabolite transporter (DMT)-like permease
MSDQTPARGRLTGIALFVLSAATFGAVDGFSKLLVASVSAPQIVWTRYALGLPFLLVVAAVLRVRGLFHTRRPGLQVVRGLTPLVTSFAMVFAVAYLSLADATVILFASPLLIVAMSGPLLGERVSRPVWFAVAIGFLAVLVVARPGFSALTQYALFPLVGAISFAVLQILTRRLSASGERPLNTLAWTLVSGAIVSTPIAIAFWQPLGLREWLLMLGLGTTFGLAQLTMIAGLAWAPAALVAPLSYVQIIAAVIFGMLVFGEVPDLWTIIGILMIVASGLYVVSRRRA